MPRINATVGEPLGPHDPEHSPLCRAFQAPGVRSVAIVGNGPLNDAQRKEIDTFDVVVRSAPAASHKFSASCRTTCWLTMLQLRCQ